MKTIYRNRQLNTKYVKSLFRKHVNANIVQLSIEQDNVDEASFAKYTDAAKKVIHNINSGTGNCILPKNEGRMKSILIYLALSDYKTILADTSTDDSFAKNFHDAAISSPNAKQFVSKFIDKFKLNTVETTPVNAIAYCKSAINTNCDKVEKKTEVYTIWTRVKLVESGIEYPGDEYVWVQAVDNKGDPVGFIPTSISNKYMHHCGNEPSVQTGDIYWGLHKRNDITNEVLTVILNNGNIAEAKSFGDQQNKFGSQIFTNMLKHCMLLIM